MIRTPHAHQMNGHSQPLLKTYHQRTASSRKLSRQFGKNKSLARVLVVVCLLAVALWALRRHSSGTNNAVTLRSEEIVLGNCASIEVCNAGTSSFVVAVLTHMRRRPSDMRTSASRHSTSSEAASSHRSARFGSNRHI